MAPVLPAETNASERPAFCRPRPTTMLDLGFFADGGERLLRHADDFGRLVDLEAAAVGIRILGQLGLDHVGAAHQLDDELSGKRCQGLQRRRRFPPAGRCRPP